MIRFRPLLVPTLWFVPAVAVMIGLGFWQIERLHQKEALIASVAAGMRAAPVPLAEVLRDGAAKAEWHHVTVDGHFVHDKEAYLFARGPMGAVGLQVVTPLVQADGKTVLVNRGFVPPTLKDPGARSAGQVTGEVALNGVLRLSQEPGMFTPPADAKEHLWFVKNVPGLAAAMDVTVEAPVIIEADATPNPGGWPLGGQTVIDFPNDHLQYALTWFGLALTLVGVYLVYHHSHGRLAFGR